MQVIQRRDDYGEERENFNRDWDDYKSGFGDPEMEFWLGNENIYMLTNAEDYSLRVELEDFEGNVRSVRLYPAHPPHHHHPNEPPATGQINRAPSLPIAGPTRLRPAPDQTLPRRT